MPWYRLLPFPWRPGLPPGVGPLMARPEGFNLLRWFAALSLACVLVSGAGTALFLSRYLTQHMLERDAAVSAEFLESIVRAERTWAWFANPAASASAEPLESFFNHVSQLPGVVRANVYGANGQVLWSSDPALIGRHFEHNDELAAALRGQVVVESGVVPKAEHVGLATGRGDARFTEAYLPVWDEARRQVVGVAEIYRTPEALFRAIDEGVRLIWLSGGLGMLLLYGALFGIAARARSVMLRQQQQLVEAEALAAIGAVASAVAHGIRNPLASIRSSAELAVLEDSAGAQECLADIQREADRVERWVRDLLLQARGEAVAPSAVDVTLLLAEAAHSFAGQASRQGVSLALATAAVPAVRAEAGALGQAIDNLVANAIEALPEGGEVHLATRALPATQQVEISVRDTGAGMPGLPGAGQLFFSTKARGTGLGLVLARRIVERQGGTLVLAPAPGGGTLASIRLPALAEGAAA